MTISASKFKSLYPSIYFAALLTVLFAGLGQASTDTLKSSEVAPRQTKIKKSVGDKKVVEVLKLKPPSTTNGQILSPGQKPPSTTLEESEKLAAPVSTQTKITNP
jgi:hypothetical protein